MIYRNSELRLDQLINYINEDKINLSPVFQRGHVWKVGMRRKLVRNIVQGRPIPAIFIYREPAGTRYSYNILDGKQRIESLILFIGNQSHGPDGASIGINDWAKYFHSSKDKKVVNFHIELPEGKRTFKDLPEDVIRDFGEYVLPTIEITLNDDTPLDEIIDLFVDINQEGEPVKRFDVVKAIGRENPLLRSVFDLIAREEKRGRDIYYKAKKNEFTNVLKSLSLIGNLADSNARVDRMWERLLEIVSFSRTWKHRQPVDILKSFIKRGSQREKPERRLSVSETKLLRRPFRFLRKAYSNGLSDTPLAKDQTHFYTMITAIIAGELLTEYGEVSLQEKLARFAELLQAPPKRGKISKKLMEYMELSKKQTTHFSRREKRQRIFTEFMAGL